jgi:hypothetical protein
LEESWMVDVGAGVYPETADIAVAGAQDRPHTLRLADGAVIDGETTRENCITASISSLYWRLIGGLYRRSTAAAIALSGKLFASIFDAEITEFGTGVALGQYGVFSNLSVHHNGGVGVALEDYGLAQNVRSYDNLGVQFLASALSSVFIRCNGRAPAGSTDSVFYATSRGPIIFDHCIAHRGSIGFNNQSGSAGGGMHTIGCIAYYCGVGFASQMTRGVRMARRDNLLYGCTTNYQGYATDTGEVLADPRFVDPDANPPDYRVLSASPVAGADAGYPVVQSKAYQALYGIHGGGVR